MKTAPDIQLIDTPSNNPDGSIITFDCQHALDIDDLYDGKHSVEYYLAKHYKEGQWLNCPYCKPPHKKRPKAAV